MRGAMRKTFILIAAATLLASCRSARLQSPVKEVKTQDPIVVKAQECGRPVYSKPEPPPFPPPCPLEEDAVCDPKTGYCYIPGHCGPVGKSEVCEPGLRRPVKPEVNVLDGLLASIVLATAAIVFLKGSQII